MLVDVTLFSVPLVLAVDALCQHSVHCAILMLSLFTAAGSEAEFTTSRWNGLRDTSKSMFDEEDGTFEGDSWSSWRRSSDCSRLKLPVRPDVYSCACYFCSISEKTWLSYFWYVLIDYKQHNISGVKPSLHFNGSLVIHTRPLPSQLGVTMFANAGSKEANWGLWEFTELEILCLLVDLLSFVWFSRSEVNTAASRKALKM